LEAEGAAPFHLVASFEWFDDTGKSLGKGTLDKLWETPKRYRESITLPDKKLLEVDNGTQLWRTGEWSLPDMVGLGFSVVSKPFYEMREGDRLSIAPPTKESSNLDCVGTEPALPGAGSDVPLALTTYCMAKGNHLLRTIYRPNLVQIAFNDIAPFDKTYIPRTVLVVKGRRMLRLHVDRLETVADFGALDEPPATGAQLLPFHRADDHRRSGELMHAQLLTKGSLRAPLAGLRGNIVVRVSIDRTGSVSNAEVISSDNQILKAPVLTAVKQWKFRAAYEGDKVVEDFKFLSFKDGDDNAN
jgi:TonB family protein